MTSVGDVIQPGQVIPDDVTEFKDNDDDHWWRGEDGLFAFSGHEWFSGEELAKRTHWWPLTVTAVREQPAEPVSGLCEVGADRVTCIDTTPAHRRIYHGGRPVPPYASTEAILRDAEPQQADACPVLDLVRQYGEESYQQGIAAGQRDEGSEDHYDDKARALLARIAALVPQQPVQARDANGDPWWIHACGLVDLGEGDVSPGSPHGCHLAEPADWRPLLVGGDPAPETYDEQTLFKVYDALKRAGLSEVHSFNAVNEMQNLGLLFRERGDPAPEGEALLQARLALESATEELAQTRAENERLMSRVRHLEVELAGTQQMLDVMTAQPDPLVLSLPEVPEGTLALVDREGQRWTASGRTTTSGQPIWSCPTRERSRTYVAVLGFYGPLTAELAPPREPRTWPKVDAAPVLDDPPETVQVNGWRWHLVDQSGGRYYQPGVLIERTIQQLRELGDVTEVTE